MLWQTQTSEPNSPAKVEEWQEGPDHGGQPHQEQGRHVSTLPCNIISLSITHFEYQYLNIQSQML